MIGALIAKDLRLYTRSRLYAFLTLFGLVAYIAIYFLLPAESQEELGLGLAVEAPRDHPLVQAVLDILEPEVFETRDDLVAALEEGEVAAGLVLTQEAVASLAQGQPVDLPLYTAPGTPEYLEQALADVVAVTLNDLLAGGRLLRIDETEEVLGPDLLGEPLSLRQRILPLLVFFVLIIEALGMATLINQEVVTDTVRALLVTPLGTGEFMAAKALLSLGLAFGQALVLLLVTGQFGQAPLPLLVLLLLAGLLMTGLAFLIAAIARDYMGVLSWGIVFILPLTLPGLTTVFPGLASAWMEWIPSSFLIDGLHQALNFQPSWSQLAPDLLGLLAVGLAFLGAGSVLLRRRFR